MPRQRNKREQSSFQKLKAFDLSGASHASMERQEIELVRLIAGL